MASFVRTGPRYIRIIWNAVGATAKFYRITTNSHFLQITQGKVPSKDRYSLYSSPYLSKNY